MAALIRRFFSRTKHGVSNATVNDELIASYSHCTAPRIRGWSGVPMTSQLHLEVKHLTDAPAGGRGPQSLGSATIGGSCAPTGGLRGEGGKKALQRYKRCAATVCEQKRRYKRRYKAETVALRSLYSQRWLGALPAAPKGSFLGDEKACADRLCVPAFLTPGGTLRTSAIRLAARSPQRSPPTAPKLTDEAVRPRACPVHGGNCFAPCGCSERRREHSHLARG